MVSLGDGANNMESTKEQIFENIRLHKEVLQSVKMQPWSMRRKLRLVRQVCGIQTNIRLQNPNDVQAINQSPIDTQFEFVPNAHLFCRQESILHAMKEHCKNVSRCHAARKIYGLDLRSF